METDGNKLLEYAYSKFQEEKYDEALEAFILTYSKGYQKEWVLDNIYGCYVKCNEQEFRKTYEQHKLTKDIRYEDCILDFIPYKDGEYYMFDKEQKKFCGIFSFSELQNASLDILMQNVEFSAVALEMDWNWNLEKHILADARRRKIYAICHDMRRCMSFYKIPELADYMRNVKIFCSKDEFQLYFHENTSEYLPWIFYGLEEDKDRLANIVLQEHKYRLTPNGRNTENILLTIGIPTYDRGNLALQRVKNLLKLKYDSEIEILVSKNGTRLYQEEYRKIAEISDARLHYVDYNRELSAQVNWRNVVRLAKGKYVLFVSDEDDVLLDALEHYLSVLKDSPGLALVKSSTLVQYPSLETKYCKRGVEAFEAVFLMNNYLSGNIVKRELFMELPFENIEEYAKYNQYYIHYSHDWWFSLLAFSGDCRIDNLTLIAEGDSVLDEQLKVYKQESICQNGILPYATYVGRLEQFKGYISFIHFIEEKGTDVVKAGVKRAIMKTPYLLIIAYSEYNFKREEMPDVIEEYGTLCVNAIEEFPLNLSDKEYLLKCVIFCIRKIMEVI